MIIVPPLGLQGFADVRIPRGTTIEFVVATSTFHYILAGPLHVRAHGINRPVCAGTLLIQPPGPRRLRGVADSHILTMLLPDQTLKGRFAVEPSAVELTPSERTVWDERVRAVLDSPSAEARSALLTAMNERCIDVARRRAAKRSPLVESVLEFLSGSVATPPTLDEVADHFGYAPNYLNRVVTATTGRSLHQWNLLFRLEAARRALATPHASVRAVASSLGFEASYFARRFASRYRLSPKEWRDASIAAPQRRDAIAAQAASRGVLLSVAEREMVWDVQVAPELVATMAE